MGAHAGTPYRTRFWPVFLNGAVLSAGGCLALLGVFQLTRFVPEPWN